MKLVLQSMLSCDDSWHKTHNAYWDVRYCVLSFELVLVCGTVTSSSIDGNCCVGVLQQGCLHKQQRRH